MTADWVNATARAQVIIGSFTPGPSIYRRFAPEKAHYSSVTTHYIDDELLPMLTARPRLQQRQTY